MMNLITLHIVYTTRHVKKFNMAVAGSMHILCGTEVTTIEREKMQPSFNLQQGNIYILCGLQLEARAGSWARGIKQWCLQLEGAGPPKSPISNRPKDAFHNHDGSHRRH